jgi:hypothetical protein
VSTLTVVEDLKVFEDSVGQFHPGAPAPPVEQLDLHPAPEVVHTAGLFERPGALAATDVMDSAEVPLADWPHYDALSFGDAMHCLSVFVGSPKLAALVVTEINPDNDPDGLLVRQFIDAFADAMRPVAANAARR